MSLLNTIPMELENIVLNYKEQFETYEKQFNKIEELIKNTTDLEIRGLQVNMLYEDLRDFIFKHDLLHLKVKIGYCENGDLKNLKFFDIDLIRDDDTMLEGYLVDEIIYSMISNTLFIKLNTTDNEEMSEDTEEEDVEMEIDYESDSSIDWEHDIV